MKEYVLFENQNLTLDIKKIKDLNIENKKYDQFI